MPMNTTLETRPVPPATSPRDSARDAGHDLLHDLRRRQVAGQAGLARGAERAVHPAAGLRRHAHRHPLPAVRGPGSASGPTRPVAPSCSRHTDLTVSAAVAGDVAHAASAAAGTGCRPVARAGAAGMSVHCSGSSTSRANQWLLTWSARNVGSPAATTASRRSARVMSAEVPGGLPRRGASRTRTPGGWLTSADPTEREREQRVGHHVFGIRLSRRSITPPWPGSRLDMSLIAEVALDRPTRGSRRGSR